MKRILLVLCSFAIGISLKAQESVSWASRVIEVSSEMSPLEYSAMQVLHKPNVLPNGGDNPNAWTPNKADRTEFITVAFEKPIRAQQIAIAESQNPGAISQVYAYDASFNEFLLFELTPRAIPIESRLLNLFFERTSYEIAGIRLVIDGRSIKGLNSIDAIGISDSNIPITVLVNIAQNVNQNLETVEKLGENVNSSYVEHSPIISPDGKYLFFSRQYHPQNVGGVDDAEDIWYSEWNEEKQEWNIAKNAGPPLNTKGPNFVSSITQENGEMILLLGNQYGKKGKMFAGASMSKLVNGEWAEPENIEIENDYNYNSRVDYSLSADGKAMIISSERDDTYGGRDLYVSFKKGNGTWSEPKNLGGDINNASDEQAPFLTNDNKTLYFSTKGISGYGGADIFVTTRLDDTWQNWSEPENLGAGINTASDDIYFNMPTSGKHAYFSRGVENEDTDIYRFEIQEFFIESDKLLATTELDGAKNKNLKLNPRDVVIALNGRVLDEKTQKPVIATIMIERLPDGVDIGAVKTNPETGEFHFSLRGGAHYGVITEAAGYISLDRNLDLNQPNPEEKTRQLDLFMVKLEKGAEISFNNIFFDLEKYELKTASYPELERIKEMLEAQKIGKIEISGHTDTSGPEDYNQRLSELRARAVYNYFINNGIDKARLTVIGYGETKPKVPNDTRENREKNRRVEFKIME
jgi:OmpA-OmpF porin, OOP family